MPLPKRNDIRSFIYDWNIRYPIDRWWREKHKVAFGSPVHRVSSFVDMLIEWNEDKMFNDIRNQQYEQAKLKEEGVESTDYVAGSGNWLKKQEMSQGEIDNVFDNLDLSKFDDK